MYSWSSSGCTGRDGSHSRRPAPSVSASAPWTCSRQSRRPWWCCPSRAWRYPGCDRCQEAFVTNVSLDWFVLLTPVLVLLLGAPLLFKGCQPFGAVEPEPSPDLSFRIVPDLQ